MLDYIYNRIRDLKVLIIHFISRETKITKLYSDLPPGDRIKKLFEEKLSPFLTEHGFRFIKSKNLFKRNVGPLTQEIYIAKGKWNRADEVCTFWLIFSVIAENYNDWHKNNYGEVPQNNVVIGYYHNHLKNWKTRYKLDKYNLSKQDNNKVFEEIKDIIEKLVFPLFEKYSDFEKAGDALMERQAYWWSARIHDFYLIAGRPEKAKIALLKGEEYFKNQIDPQKEAYEALRLRLNRF